MPVHTLAGHPRLPPRVSMTKCREEHRDEHQDISGASAQDKEIFHLSMEQRQTL